MKKCTLCGEKKDVSEFYKNRSFKDGLSCWCVSCSRKEAKKSRDTNKEALSLRRSIWRAKNPEKTSSHFKKHYLKNKDELKRRKSIKLANPEYKEKVLESTRNWKSRNKEIVKANSSKYRKEHMENCSVYRQNRRARKNNNGGSFSVSEWINLKEIYGNKCLCCKAENVPLQSDHVIPLSLGGRNSIDNIQPLCQHCNCKKHVKIIDYRNNYALEK